MSRPASGRGSPPPRRRSLLDWKAAVGILISSAALYFTFRRMDLADVVRELRAADPLLLGLSAAIVTFVFWIRAWRWRAILEPVADTTFRSRFAAVTIGFMGNNLLPARVGEFMRAYALSRLEPVPLVASFASLVIERLFDGALVIALLFVALSLPAFPAFSGAESIALPGFGQSFTIAGLARGMGFLVGGVMLLLLALVLFPRRAVAAFERVLAVLPDTFRRPLIDALEAFLSGVGVLRNPLLLLRTGSWSAVLWLTNALGCWIAFRAFGYDLPFAAALFFQSAIALAVSVPSAPGFVGVYHGMATFVLASLWDQPLASAGAFAVGFHLAGFIPVTLIGLYYAWHTGMSLRDATDSETVVEEAVEHAVEEAAADDIAADRDPEAAG
ncbi:MAG: lysylphosphatidylglycerol synthase transmembrane domain-containing protein [Gemmatimonadota bacterium]